MFKTEASDDAAVEITSRFPSSVRQYSQSSVLVPSEASRSSWSGAHNTARRLCRTVLACLL